MERTLLRCDWIPSRAARQRRLLQILGLNVRKEGIALMAAGDLVGDDLDTILDQYRAQSSTLGLLTEYLAGEKDSSLNLDNLKKQLKRGKRKSAFGVGIPMPLFVSLGGNLTHGKSIQ